VSDLIGRIIVTAWIVAFCFGIVGALLQSIPMVAIAIAVFVGASLVDVWRTD
jgi:hypothetical protein